jgi:hypothetical protein
MLENTDIYILRLLRVLMVKTILLKFDETFFYKMKEDKLRREKESKKEMSWEVYVAIIFGMAKVKR